MVLELNLNVLCPGQLWLRWSSVFSINRTLTGLFPGSSSPVEVFLGKILKPSYMLELFLGGQKCSDCVQHPKVSMLYTVYGSLLSACFLEMPVHGRTSQGFETKPKGVISPADGAP